MTGRERVILFGRLPRPGEVKTRLIPAIGARGAARLYQAFLDDAVASASSAGDLELWVPDAPGAVEQLSARYPGAAIRLQPEGDLGDRLRAAFGAAFAEGVDHAVVLGSDHPTLPPGHVERALRALRGAHLVLGPAEDGGYYAIGLRRYCWPAAAGLFEGAPWSTPDLLEWTRRRAADLALCHVELPVWYDVDGPDDLERLHGDVRAGSATGRALAALNLDMAENGDA